MTAIQNAFDTTKQVVLDAIEATANAAVNIYETVEEKYNWMGREVKKLASQYLPKELIELVDKFFKALPITLTYLLAPAPLGFGLFAGWAIIHLAVDKPFCNNTYRNVYNGLGFGAGIEVIKDTVLFATTGSPLFGIAAAISFFVASYFFSKAPEGEDKEAPAAAAGVPVNAPQEATAAAGGISKVISDVGSVD